MFCAATRLVFYALLLSTSVSKAYANTDDMVTLYFGCGCFWHVQHEFIKAEQDILGRQGSELTALSGYAGGTRLNAANNACYYDYGSNGHTEVVGLTIPRARVSDVAAVFWSMFAGKDRVDTMDVGPDYRAAVGISGGVNSPLLAEISAAQSGRVAQTFTLSEGQGDDPDTLGSALVWVYDSDTYPFYQAELYHQFHDDFMAGGNYPDSYNGLSTTLLESCGMRPTGCPNDQGSQCASSNTPAPTQLTSAPTPLPPAHTFAPTPAPTYIPTFSSQGGSGGSGLGAYPKSSTPAPTGMDSTTSGCASVFHGRASIAVLLLAALFISM